MRDIPMREIDRENEGKDLQNWQHIYRILQQAEAESCLGGWVASNKPAFGSMIAQSFELIRNLDRSLIPPIVERRERYFHQINSFLTSVDLICIPTIPSPAPVKGNFIKREGTGTGYYPGALSLTSIAGVGCLPQITLPVAEVGGVPVGLSLAARTGEDSFLLSIAQKVSSAFSL